MTAIHFQLKHNIYAQLKLSDKTEQRRKQKNNYLLMICGDLCSFESVLKITKTEIKTFFKRALKIFSIELHYLPK